MYSIFPVSVPVRVFRVSYYRSRLSMSSWIFTFSLCLGRVDNALSNNVVQLPGTEPGQKHTLIIAHTHSTREAVTTDLILTPTPDQTIRQFHPTEDAALLRSSVVLPHESSQSSSVSCSAASDRCSQTTTSDDTFRRLPLLPPTDLADVLLPVGCEADSISTSA